MNQGIRLFHFWSSPESQRVRLALGFKALAWTDHPLDYHDDATFYRLGIARKVPVLQLPGLPPLTDSLDILWRSDTLFPGEPALTADRIDESEWKTLLAWRRDADQLLQRLYAPVRLCYRGFDENARSAYARAVKTRFGLSVEALASDRYDAFRQFANASCLGELVRRLARHGYYQGEPSAADLVLAADLFPLQLHDGVTLPIDLLYYLERVQEVCRINLNEGLLQRSMSEHG